MTDTKKPTSASNALLKALELKKAKQNRGYGADSKKIDTGKGNSGGKRTSGPSASSSIGHRPTGK